MAVESFEVSQQDEYGDLLNRPRQARPLKVGVYTSAYFEYYRMYPRTLEAFVNSDVAVVMGNLRRALGAEAELVWPGTVTTMDQADAAGRRFRDEQVDLVVFIMFTYTVDVISIQCLRYVENTPLVVFLRQSHRDIDFKGNYEQTLRNSAMISAAQLTGTFRKMGMFPTYEVVVGADDDPEAYARIRGYASAVRVRRDLRETTLGIIGHVFRGMYDHEFDRTRIAGALGPQVIDIQVSHLLDIWEKVTEKDVRAFRDSIPWIRQYEFSRVTEEDFLKECRFAIAYRRLIERFRLDGCCYLGQHFVEVKTGCTGYLSNMFFGREKRIMTNTEGDVNGLIMMCIMNMLTGQTPLFGEWGEFGIRENAMQIMMHGYADPDLAKEPRLVTITPTPENWGFTGKGFSMEFTAKPGVVTVGHFIDDRRDGWRMLISRAEAMDVEQSIPCEDVTLVLRTETPIVEYVRNILLAGFDHHAIICYGDVTRELGQVADLMGIRKSCI